MSSANTPIYPSIDKPWMKHLSKRAKGLQVPEGTMFDLIYENNKDYPNELALKYMDIQVTFAEMWEHIEEVVKAREASTGDHRVTLRSHGHETANPKPR